MSEVVITDYNQIYNQTLYIYIYFFFFYIMLGHDYYGLKLDAIFMVLHLIK